MKTRASREANPPTNELRPSSPTPPHNHTNLHPNHAPLLSPRLAIFGTRKGLYKARAAPGTTHGGTNGSAELRCLDTGPNISASNPPLTMLEAPMTMDETFPSRFGRAVRACAACLACLGCLAVSYRRVTVTGHETAASW